MTNRNSGHPRNFAVTRRTVLGTGTGAAVAVAMPMRMEAHAQETATLVETGNTIRIAMSVNSRPVELQVDSRASLLDVLRERVAFTGPKKGCDHGQCGACTVHLNGRTVVSCLTLAAKVNGAEVTTIEGIARGNELHPMQQAFIDQDALQCGYCTPGQIMSAIACVEHGHAADKDSIREFMSGNICRCAAYVSIVAAIESVAAQGKGG